MFEAVARQFLTFLHNLVVFYLALFCAGYFHVPNLEVLAAIPLVLITMVSWGAVMGMISSRFRDLRFMIPYIAQLVFFITPIFWRPTGTVSGWRRSLVNYNPFYGLIEIIREPLLGVQPSAICWIQSVIAMVSGLIVCAIVFSVFRRRIPFWV